MWQNKTQKEMIKSRFSIESYYQLCKTIHRVFSEDTTTINMSVQDLFCEAVFRLDNLLRNPNKALSELDDIWNDTFTEFREHDEKIQPLDTTIEVTMLLYSLLMALVISPDHRYRGVARSIHKTIYAQKKEKAAMIEKELLVECRKHNEDIELWIKQYHESGNYFSEEIKNILKEAKSGRSAEDKMTKATKPKKKRGGQQMVLFNIEKVNPEIEKDRFVNYLNDHALQNISLNASKKNELNKVIVAFTQIWIERGILFKQISAPALYGFLTEDCKLKSDVEKDTYSNKISIWIKNMNFVDDIIRKKVSESF